MKHMTLAAKATTTDRGEVTLLVSTYDRDRGGDVIEPGAFAETIAKWQRSKKKIPLHFDHKGEPESIIGAADPHSMRETDQGLIVEAKLDLEESEKAREVWRLVRSGVVACSFGYLAEASREQSDGTRLLTKIDLFEVTLTPSPMNPETRVLDYKRAADRPEPSAEMKWLHEYLQRDPDEVVREHAARQRVAAETKRAETPITVATFGVE